MSLLCPAIAPHRPIFGVPREKDIGLLIYRVSLCLRQAHECVSALFKKRQQFVDHICVQRIVMHQHDLRRLIAQSLLRQSGVVVNLCGDKGQKLGSNLGRHRIIMQLMRPEIGAVEQPILVFNSARGCRVSALFQESRDRVMLLLRIAGVVVRKPEKLRVAARYLHQRHKSLFAVHNFFFKLFLRGVVKVGMGVCMVSKVKSPLCPFVQYLLSKGRSQRLHAFLNN